MNKKTFDGYMILVDGRFQFATTNLTDADFAVARYKKEYPNSEVIYVVREMDIPTLKRWIILRSKHYPGYELVHAVDKEDIAMETGGWQNCNLDADNIVEAPDNEREDRKITDKLFELYEQTNSNG